MKTRKGTGLVRVAHYYVYSSVSTIIWKKRIVVGLKAVFWGFPLYLRFSQKLTLLKPNLESAVLYLQIYTAMRITITEPVTDTQIELDAEPEDYNGEQGWRIIYPSKDSFVIVHKDGEWNG